MINGAHIVIFSNQADAVRVFLRDLLGGSSVDAGEGWLITALPPAEVAVHPTDMPSRHELYLLCDDVAATLRELGQRGIECGPVAERDWGLLTSITLPDGSTIGLYQPKHPRAVAPS